MKIRNILPYSAYSRLWGDRQNYGLKPDVRDPDWIVWQEKGYTDFYQTTQQKGIGNWVGGLSFPVVGQIEFKNKVVLEIGPGIIRHINYIHKNPQKYILVDVNKELLKKAQKQFKDEGFSCETILIDSGNRGYLPLADESIDIIVTFNSLEHLYPLETYLTEMRRLLKSDGLIVGGIPCEGGLAWGLGRFFTTRRYVHKNYDINYDKIICWEHPNFADFILKKLESYFKRKYFRLHPFLYLPMDFNLMASFIFKKDCN